MIVNSCSQGINSYQLINSKKVISDKTLVSKTGKLSDLPFKGRPWVLPKIKQIDAYAAIALYSYFKAGQYLDASDDDVAFENKQLREGNLQFLNELTTSKDKQSFVEYYKDITGFPNLAKVSDKIEKEFIVGIKKSCAEIPNAECLAAGYDETCSVGKGKAFPGSDLDKAFIILNGSYDNNLQEDEEIVNRFKSNLWNNIDQRILSFNHDISFPTVYTDNQLFKVLDAIKSKTAELDIDKRYLNQLMDEEFVNLAKASKYNIAVSDYFPVASCSGGLNKEDVKNVGYLVEAIREGKWVITSKTGLEMKNRLGKDYEFYNYSNVAQMRAMKKAVNEGRENKSKIILRNDIEKNFNSWSIDCQYDFIKTLIKYSCEDNDDFSEYFTNDRNVKDAYKPLLNKLTQGNSKIYNRPEFIKIDNGLCMKYAEGKFVNLYPGYNEKVLWIDSPDYEAIRQTERMVNKIKQCELFCNIEKLQCPSLESFVPGFYPINYKTIDGKCIFERVL